MCQGDLKAYTADDLISVEQDVQESQKREADQRSRESWRALDFQTRAVRLEETPKLVEANREKKIVEAQASEIAFANFKKTHLAMHEKAAEEKKRLAKMSGDHSAYRQTLISRREKSYHEDLQAQRDRLDLYREKIADAKARDAQRKEEEEAAAAQAAAIAEEEEADAKAEAEAAAAEKEKRMEEMMKRQEEQVRSATTPFHANSSCSCSVSLLLSVYKSVWRS
jgi:hypothetical protein